VLLYAEKNVPVLKGGVNVGETERSRRKKKKKKPLLGERCSEGGGKAEGVLPFVIEGGKSGGLRGAA